MKNKTVVIIGGGISGVSAAEELTKLGYQVKILEKEDRLGGKIYSVRELATKGGVPELGAMVMTSNYPTIDTIVKYNIETKPVLQSDSARINQIIYGKSAPSFYDKASYAVKFIWQYIKFAGHVWSYNTVSARLEEKPPINQLEAFDQFCQNQGLGAIARFQKIWVPGMGYGDLQHNQAYRVIRYMGYGTMLSLAIGSSISHNLLTVLNGYQTVVEKIAESMDVEILAQVDSIERNPAAGGAIIHYTKKDGEKESLHVDYVVLTMSPYYWKDLNMKLTPTEQQCVNELKCIPYSTAVVDIEDYSNKQVFVPEALDAKGFGHVGFISTKGEGRCVVYINRDPDDDVFSLSDGSPGRQMMLDDLSKLGYDKVNILKTKDWPDYNATIPWALGMSLERQQGENSTFYVGTYRPTSFESVAAAEASARAMIRRFFGVQEEGCLESTKKHIVRAYNFFFMLPKKGQRNVGVEQQVAPQRKF